MTTKNLKKQLDPPKKVEQHEIGSMLRHVQMDTGIPGHMYNELAKEIEREFNVVCSALDIRNYEALWSEDYELEARRSKYDLQGGFRAMFS